jgi:hypothetical protein
MSNDHASGDTIPVPTGAKDPDLPTVGFSSMWDSEVDGLYVLETEIDDWERAERRGHQERNTWTWWTWAVAPERWTPRDVRERLFELRHSLIRVHFEARPVIRREVRSVIRKFFGPGGPRGPQRPMPA